MPVALPPGFAIGAAKPEDALGAFAERGLLQPTFNWYDVWQQEHAAAFMVAGVAQADVLRLFRGELDKSLATGGSLADFRKAVLPTLQAKGFWGDVEITDPKTGEVRFTRFDDARLQLIYDTNLRQSYAAGRWAAIERNKKRQPLVMYRTMRDERVRASHAQWDGVVLPVDHPFWRTHYPPNGWRCRCRAFALSARDVDRYRADGVNIKTSPPPVTEVAYRDPRTGETAMTPVGIDPGFAYNPGLARQGRLRQLADDAQRAPVVAPPPAPVAPPPARARAFEPQPSTKAAAKWAKDNDLADRIDYAGIKPEVANAWNESLFNHVRDFPELRANQKYTGTTQAQLALWHEGAVERTMVKLRDRNPGFDEARLRAFALRLVKPPRTKSTTWAHSMSDPNFSGVAVNKKFGADPEGWKASLARNVNSGYHPPGCDTIRSVVDHELGHQLDQLLDLGKDAEVLKVYSEARVLGIKGQLSGCAATNIQEFIAEAWTESLNNPAPRPIAQRIAAIVKARYAAKFPAF